MLAHGNALIFLNRKEDIMKKIAPFLVLTAGILWGLIGVFVRKLNRMGFGSMDIVTIRAIATVFLLFLFLFCYKKEMLLIRWKDLWCFVGTGILSIVFFNFCYFKAITITSLSVAAVLLYTAPAMVMLMSAILFREKITGIKVIAIVLTFLGCILVTGLTGSGEHLSTYGILVGLGAGFGYALYSIFSRFALQRGYHSLTITFYTFLFAMAGTIPLSNGNEILERCRNLPVIGFCLLFGALSTVIPYIVYTLGLNELENSQASIIASIEPVTATLLGVLAYKESLTLTQMLGVVLVLGSIAITNRKKADDKAATKN